ncbi:hypothetical protein [Flavobacterium macrobrachii]|uniref:Uncharacterized protein n=1 Tax=Flavobacterium macrobrachii TaxID=591204 RepID=A0ABS2CWL8_9FLAO|nr:hypothetical protein [Flavobacterium macrobrachii]MBM6499357.1 hypothetical protein [Flavobacterium macrobrachii]
MKFFAYLLCFYLFALTTLPSVRAIKMQFSEKCQSTCQKMNSDKEEQSGCEKGKIIMNLSFNPVHYETSQSFSTCAKIIFVDVSHKENNSYKEVFISQYKNSIWQPPKIFSVV